MGTGTDFIKSCKSSVSLKHQSITKMNQIKIPQLIRPKEITE